MDEMFVVRFLDTHTDTHVHARTHAFSMHTDIGMMVFPKHKDRRNWAWSAAWLVVWSVRRYRSTHSTSVQCFFFARNVQTNANSYTRKCCTYQYKMYDSSSLCLVSPCIHPIIPLGLLLLFALLLLLLLPLLMSLLFCMWQISNRMFEFTFWATSGNSYHTHTITYRCAMCVCMKVEIAPIHRQKTRFCRAPFFGVFYICTHSHTNSTSTEISACLEQMRKVDFYPIWWSNSANFDNHNKYRVCHPFWLIALTHKHELCRNYFGSVFVCV